MPSKHETMVREEEDKHWSLEGGEPEKTENVSLDEYGYVIYTKPAVQEIVFLLSLPDPKTILLPFSDGKGSQFDILFSYTQYVMGERVLLQGGIKKGDLFVSVMRKGSFAFRRGQRSHPDYYAEKLGVYSEELACFLNDIRLGLK